MSYYYTSAQLNMSDRIAIETGICKGESFKKNAKRIGRHPSTVAHEVKTNRTIAKGHFFLGNDCKSLNPYTDEDITLLMNNINSIKRQSLGNKSPYELITDDDEDMHDLMFLMEMDPIPADEVHLTPSLFKLK